MLVFKKEETSLTDEMKRALAVIKDAYAREKNITIWIEACPESSVAYSKRIGLAAQRTKTISTLLIREYGIPQANIKSDMSKKAAKEPTVKVMVRPPQNKQ